MVQENVNSNQAGINRFLLPIKKLKEIIDFSKSSENTTLAFYQSDARQYLFYLEALSRIYKKLNNKDLFKDFKREFKHLEDQLGKVDYFEAYHKQFVAQKDFPPLLLNHLFQRYQDELNELSKTLIKDKWLDSRDNLLDSIVLKLNKVDWLKPEDEKKAIAKAIRKEIKKLKQEYESGALNFNELENGVHEFRRNVRWISINAQALDGLIQLKPDNKQKDFKKYLTEKVVDSPFNKLPENKLDINPILLSKSSFYALSWLIAESGNLKDEGLKFICIEETIRATNYVSDDKTTEEAKKLTPDLKFSPAEIKDKMKQMVDEFIFKDAVLDIFMKDLKEAY